QASALRRHVESESGVEHEGAPAADDRPHEIVERHRAIVMRIAANEILVRLAVVVTVVNGIDFVFVGHRQAPVRRPGTLIGPWPMVVIHGSGSPAGSMRATRFTSAPSSASASACASALPTHMWMPWPQPRWPRTSRRTSNVSGASHLRGSRLAAAN